MKIGTLLGLAITVALVVLALRWLRGRAAQKPRAINRDTQGDTTPGLVYLGTGDSAAKAESANDDRADKGDDVCAAWVSFDSKNTSDTKADSSTDSASESGGGEGGGGGD